MPIYHRLGEIPRKRHSIFRRPEEQGGELVDSPLSELLQFVNADDDPVTLAVRDARMTSLTRSAPNCSFASFMASIVV